MPYNENNTILYTINNNSQKVSQINGLILIYKLP